MEDVASPTAVPLRKYQVELLEHALRANTIVCLGTGAGKTFIAIMAAKELAHTTTKSIRDGGKRILFIVPSVALVSQQADAFRTHTNLKVGQYTGSTIVGWDETTWRAEFDRQQVLVMTSQILVNLLNSAHVRFAHVSLLVLDECHHAVGNHPYRQLMTHYDGNSTETRIIGLTASIVTKKCKPDRVSHELKRLESTLQCQCVTASDLTSVHQYGTKPDEQIVLYHDSSVPRDVIALLETSVEFLSNVVLPAEESMGKLCSNMKKEILGVISLMYDVGPSTCLFFLKNITECLAEAKQQRSNAHLSTCLVTWYATQLNAALRLCQSFKWSQSCFDVELGVSPKARALLQCLMKFCTDIGSSNLRALVFVERRVTARMLCHFLKNAVSNNDVLSSVHADWTVGSGGGNNEEEEEEEEATIPSHSKVALERFREGEINVLVTTNAVEEGVDIPACNLVVQYDLPTNVRGYIQSKGRARKRPSMYVVFVKESRQSEVEEQLDVFAKTEEALYDLAGREPDDSAQHEVENNEIEMPQYQTPSGAIATMSSSAQILNSYCSSLPKDEYTDSLPIYEVFKTDENLYIAKVTLPVTSKQKDPVQSCRWRTKKLARHHAALLMVKELHCDGHLTDQFSSTSPSSGIRKEKKKKRTYKIYDVEIKVASVLTDCKLDVKRAAYLYRFHFESSSCIEEGLGNENESLGIVSVEPLEEIPSFSLFSETGPIQVSLRSCTETPFLLSSKDIRNINVFHHTLFSDVLQITSGKEMKFDSASTLRGYRVVPLRNDDWSSRKCIINKRFFTEITTKTTAWRRRAFSVVPLVAVRTSEWDHLWKIDTHLLDKLFSQGIWNRSSTYESLINAVVSPSYLSGADRLIFRGVALLENLTPKSPFIDLSKAATYSEYMEKRHGVFVDDDQQPLLQVAGISIRNLNYLSPVQRRSSSRGTMRLVPSTCERHVLSYRRLVVAKFVPSILYRIESLLTARELATIITTDNAFTKHSIDDSVDHLSALRRCPPARDSSDVLVALTSAAAQAAFNSERLELLGDSFLKFALSVSLFFGFETEHEGQLTERRMKLIKNKYLCQLAFEKNLPGYIIGKRFDPSAKSWLPPGYETTTETTSLHRQELSGKSIADAVESLLGLFLHNHGCSQALRYLNWVGVELTDAVFDVFGATYKSQGRRQSISDPFLFSGFEDFESSVIGYSFRNRYLLLEALTHASYHFNRSTDCYQRMEFLGDALLDFLVTLHIYETKPHMGPGQLTELRSAIVCNESFAKLAARSGFHKHLKALSPSLFQHIEAFVKNLPEDDDDECVDVIDSFEKETSSDARCLDDVYKDRAFPKVLSDIFESVAAAVFIDSAMSLESVWRVFFPLMKDIIVKYSDENPPHHPVSTLTEKGFSVGAAQRRKEGDDFVSVVELPNNVVVRGCGSTAKSARLDAAKRALAHLARIE